MIVKMKRIHLLALQRDHDALLHRLQHLGCVQISEPDAEVLSLDLQRCDSAVADCTARQRQLRSAIDFLRRLAPQKSSLLAPRAQISEADYLNEASFAAQMATAETVNTLVAELNRLTAHETQLHSEKVLLEPWAALDLPLELTETRCVDVTCGTLPPFADYDAVQGELYANVEEVELHRLFADKEQQCLLLLSHKSATAQALGLLRSHGFTSGQLKGRSGTVSDALAALTQDAEETKAQKAEVLAKIVALGSELPQLQLCADRLASRLMREENRQRLLTDGHIVCFDGWVPEEKLEQLTAYLDTVNCDYAIADPTEEEIPAVPVKLKNNFLTRSLSMVTEMYSLPAYDGIDANPLMAPFFILFFGVMMADIGYGLLMILASLVYLKKARPAESMRNFMELVLWCGISTLVVGAMTGGFFGDFIPQLLKLIDPSSTFTMPALFTPLDDTVAIMVGSLALGVIQIFTGMAVSVVHKCKNGDFMSALWDEITWWIILAGVALFALGIGTVGGVPIVLALGGAMLCVGCFVNNKGLGKLTALGGAIYNGVTGFFSDILSYIRLMALMLAGSVIAQVFNTLGAAFGNVVLFVIVAMIGNALNLALNLLGCYVHDLRLQYLEFFGRFYKEGGKPYQPLRFDAKHVEIIKEEH